MQYQPAPGQAPGAAELDELDELDGLDELPLSEELDDPDELLLLEELDELAHGQWSHSTMRPCALTTTLPFFSQGLPMAGAPCAGAGAGIVATQKVRSISQTTMATSAPQLRRSIVVLPVHVRATPGYVQMLASYQPMTPAAQRK
jgi:hypothetical protein